MPAGEQGPTETGESGHSIRPLITGLYTTTPRIVQILPLRQSRHLHRSPSLSGDDFIDALKFIVNFHMLTTIVTMACIFSMVAVHPRSAGQSERL